MLEGRARAAPEAIGKGLGHRCHLLVAGLGAQRLNDYRVPDAAASVSDVRGK